MAYALEVATSTPRPGRRFEPIQELELHSDAVAATRSLRNASKGLIIVPEFAGPIGIPDFTAFVGDIDRVRRRHSLPVAPVLNEIDTGVLSAANVRRPLSAEVLANNLGWPVNAVADRLPGLIRRGSLRETTRGKYVRPMELEPGGRLYAIEAKVNDWRSALRQVRTYRVWADGYVIVMGNLSETAQEALTAQVHRDGGGLMLAGKWITRPRIGQSAARRRLQAWEMFAAATGTALNDPALALAVHP